MIHMKKTDDNIKFKVMLYNDFTEPYSYGDDLDKCVCHRETNEYTAYDEKTFYKVLDDFLDAPKKKLTAKDIRKDFDDIRRKLSDEKVEVIRTYYNGRYDLSKKIHSKLDKIDFSKIDIDFPVVMKFNIPFHMNYFTCEDNDPYDAAVKMNDAYLYIEISKKMDNEQM